MICLSPSATMLGTAAKDSAGGRRTSCTARPTPSQGRRLSCRRRSGLSTALTQTPRRFRPTQVRRSWRQWPGCHRRRWPSTAWTRLWRIRGLRMTPGAQLHSCHRRCGQGTAPATPSTCLPSAGLTIPGTPPGGLPHHRIVRLPQPRIARRFGCRGLLGGHVLARGIL